MLQLKINTLCDDTTRAKHRDALTDFLRGKDGTHHFNFCRDIDDVLSGSLFFTRHAERHESLSETSQHRLDAGSVLRVLDSKDPGDQACLEGAPSLLSVASDNAIKRCVRADESSTPPHQHYHHHHHQPRDLCLTGSACYPPHTHTHTHTSTHAVLGQCSTWASVGTE